jgi:predicted Rdx family selenoprotein
LSVQFAQELISTFSTTIGEVALIPAIGGIFTVTLVSYKKAALPFVKHPTRLRSDHQTYAPPGQQLSNDPNSKTVSPEEPATVETVLLWDRKADGGFPETKVLKQRVRDCLDPDRNLGHSDTLANQKPVANRDVAVSLEKGSMVEEVVKSDVKSAAEKTVACDDCT